MLYRTHPVYKTLTRRVLEGEGNIAEAYEKYARLYGVYNPTFYAEAVKLGEKLKTSKSLGSTIKAVVGRLSEWPVVYGLIVCKQVPVKRLSKIIENKSFRPLAEELMTVIFGV